MSELRDWLTLIHAEGVGPITVSRLLQTYKTPAAICAASEVELNGYALPRAAIHSIKHPDIVAIETDLRWMEQANQHIIPIIDARYPARLKELADAPIVLYVVGNVESLRDPQLAIVGSRNPTTVGAQLAEDFAHELANVGLAITSGLATGIDTCAHRGALNSEHGVSIAVMGTGANRIYPAANKKLAAQLTENGALVSEFPLNMPAKPGHFPRRNRIISGLSLGVLVVEASKNSGSLITAHCAAMQNREVFAIPGSIHNPMVKGCHALIRGGAKLVETVEDILLELKDIVDLTPQVENKSKSSMPKTALALDHDHKTILDNIGYEPESIDRIVERCGLTVDVVASSLLLLELEGYVINTGHGHYHRTSKNLVHTA